VKLITVASATIAKELSNIAAKSLQQFFVPPKVASPVCRARRRGLIVQPSKKHAEEILPFFQ